MPENLGSCREYKYRLYIYLHFYLQDLTESERNTNGGQVGSMQGQSGALLLSLLKYLGSSCFFDRDSLVLSALDPERIGDSVLSAGEWSALASVCCCYY